MKIDLKKLVAPRGVAPHPGQSPYPARLVARQSEVRPGPELERILKLPRRPVVGERTIKAQYLVSTQTARFARPDNDTCDCARRRRDCITTLRTTQAWALKEITEKAGLLGPIGVGHGKTLLDILTPLAMPGCKIAVLLLPPTLAGQLVEEYLLVRNHFHVPSLISHKTQESWIVRGAPVLHIFPYSKLSRADATTWLDLTKPDTIIADEVHKLRHADTATTSRVIRYIAANPGTRFCGWSGSITDSSIADYSHLSGWALREGSPLPLGAEVTKEWARAIDPSDNPAPPGDLLELCRPGETIHDGFHRRLVETPGVVTTTAPAVDAELVITERTIDSIPTTVRAALRDLRNTWTRPDGEEFMDALSMTRCARELAAGFYYRWIFPRGEPAELIDRWFKARAAWHKQARQRLADRVEYLDSPLLVARAARRGWEDDSRAVGSFWWLDDESWEHPLPAWKAETWPEWRDIRGQVQPETEPVRVDPYLAEDAVRWALDNRGIVWYEHGAFGEWVAEIGNLPLHGGGPDAGKLIGQESGATSIVASIRSHGTGRDGLQRIFATQLVANPPSSAATWEQLLGRLHRIGQTAEAVHAEFYRHTDEVKAHVDQALNRALYVQRTLGSEQKLRMGWQLQGE